MSTNFVAQGLTVDHAPSADRAAGAASKIGVRLGVAVNAVASGVSGVFAVAGVFTLPKLSTDVVAQGDLLYWDDGNRRLTTTASTHIVAGYAYAASGNGATTVQIAINA